ncbi:hypothetical protein cypCar_00032799 [Cyprinus carpio]|nr:hypothetical protein cypCar_00032799 [Cyprinus carpio]
MASISTDQNTQPTPQLLSVGEKDKKRLLEVYVKRSLSLNDGSQCPLRQEQRSRKWVAITEPKTRHRKHSSDTSLNLTSQASISDEDVRYEPVVETQLDEKETSSEKKSKKWSIKGSLRRNDSSNASQKSNNKPKWFQRLDKGKEGSIDALPPQTSTVTPGDMHSNVLDNVETATVERKGKEGKKTKKPTLLRKWKPTDLITYEKMSEELEKLVHEVKDSPADDNATFQITDQNGVNVSKEDIIKRITELIKQEGDLIHKKMQKNSTVSNYLDGFTYGLFQQMADQYVQSEVPNKKTQLPVVAPELVKFAFTLDFTARVANLHHQATGQIMGFGNQYLQDRFTHMSESHPHLSDFKAEDWENTTLSKNS